MLPEHLQNLPNVLNQDLQRTEEWFKQRLGKVTGSEVFKVLAKGKGGAPSKTRRSYAVKLASERLSNQVGSSFDTPALAWGRDQEANAIKEFEDKFGVDVVQVGFIDHPDIPMCGVSLDGMVGNNATLEIKAKNSENHLAIILSGECPEEHLPQIQLGLSATNREFCYFVSYDPRYVDEHLKLFVVRVERDEDYIENLKNEVNKFLLEVEEILESLNKLK